VQKTDEGHPFKWVPGASLALTCLSWALSPPPLCQAQVHYKCFSETWQTSWHLS
jgi:hypothetical protein